MRRSLVSMASLAVAGVMAVSSTTTAATAKWNFEDSHTFNTLKGIAFSDECHGWAVGEPPDNNAGSKAPIVHTSDGGRTWHRQNSRMPDTTLNRVEFVDNMHGWAVGEPRESVLTAGPGVIPGTILRTIDGGRHWLNQSANTSVEGDFEGVSFVSRKEGWIAVSTSNFGPSGGQILHTANRGATWESQAIPVDINTLQAPDIADVYFVDALNGWAVDDNGEILHTSNGGQTGIGGWAVQYTPLNQSSLEAVSFYDALNGVAVGDDNLILTTSDGGVTWNDVSFPPFAGGNTTTFNDVTYPMAGLISIVGEAPIEGRQAAILVSTDSGVTFHREKAGTGGTLNSVAYPRDDNHGWASGEFGALVTNEKPGC